MSCVFLVLYILLSVNSSLSSNILAFLPTKARSHYGAFEPLLKELAIRGHNMTVLSPFPLKNPPPTYHHIQVEDEVLETCKYQINSPQAKNINLLKYIL